MGVYQRGGTYYIDYRDEHGTRCRKKAGTHKAVATAALDKALREVEMVKAGLMVRQDVEQFVLLEDLLTAYLRHLDLLGRTPEYQNNIQQTVRRIAKDLSWRLVAQVNIDGLYLWGRGRSGRTVNQYITYLQGMFAWGKDVNKILANPMTAWRRVKEVPSVRRDFNQDEVKRILDAAQDNPTLHMRLMIHAYTALRLASVQAIEWSWVDWQENLLVIPAEANKSNRVHTLPIAPPLREALLRYRGEHMRVDGKVFGPDSGSAISLRFRRHLTRLGMYQKGACLHSLRHTVATRVYEQHGLKAAQEFLGHINAATTMRYLHTSMEEMRDAANGLDWGQEEIA